MKRNISRGDEQAQLKTNCLLEATRTGATDPYRTPHFNHFNRDMRTQRKSHCEDRKQFASHTSISLLIAVNNWCDAIEFINYIIRVHSDDVIPSDVLQTVLSRSKKFHSFQLNGKHQKSICHREHLRKSLVLIVLSCEISEHHVLQTLNIKQTEKYYLQKTQMIVPFHSLISIIFFWAPIADSKKKECRSVVLYARKFAISLCKCRMCAIEKNIDKKKQYKRLQL